ncbi:MAG: multicopper oxidase domain-containing protein [Methylococcaceae bacterium]|nr:multicopper oxidase domain-containing protein [Methylococcaceae bacterium]OYV22215.1 MAG: hypothetical protein CG442_1422 [Methylococcaceae bacterium NSO1]
MLKKGPKETITDITGSYLGPLINLQKGQKVRVNLHNKLAEPTVTHWHGLHVPANMDGHPMYAIDPGEILVYEFEVLNRAGMNIYHPHPHEATAKQVYNGLAGALFVRDKEEEKLELPSGEFEIPIVIQDRLFDQQNQLIYVRNMHDRMMGFYGDRILVNGFPDYKIDVASRAYRLRVLNMVQPHAFTNWAGMMVHRSLSSVSMAACWKNRKSNPTSCWRPANAWMFGRILVAATRAPS